VTLKEQENFDKTYGLLQNDVGNVMTNFLNSKMPGFKISDPLTSVSALLASRNPDAVIRMNVLNDAQIPCVNVTSNETNCPKGFVLEPTTGKLTSTKQSVFKNNPLPFILSLPNVLVLVLFGSSTCLLYFSKVLKNVIIKPF
jgi:hypothetical protein